MRHPSRIMALCALVLFVLCTHVCRADSLDDGDRTTLSVQLGFDVATGKYGNQTSTTSVALPLALNYFPTPRLDLGAAIPFLWQSNSQVVAGRPVRSAKPALPVMRPTASRSRGVRGIGDLLLSSGYTVLPEGDNLPQLRPVLAVKIPTASSGLGTGAADFTFGLSSGKWLGKWNLAAAADYTVQGKTALFRARNFFDYDLGVGYEVLPGLLPSLALKGTTPAEEGTGAVMQVAGKVVYTLSRAVDLNFFLGRGLTATTPDWEGGCFLSFNF